MPMTDKLDQALMYVGQPYTFMPKDLMASESFRAMALAWHLKDDVPLDMVHKILHNGLEAGYIYAQLERLDNDE